MKTLQQKQLEFLNDTINHFNINNRGIDTKSGHCSYQKGCAIGRHLDKDLAKELDESDELSDFTIIVERFPEKLKELGGRFLIDIQQLHDYGSNWNETGLSQRGVERVETIKNIFNL